MALKKFEINFGGMKMNWAKTMVVGTLTLSSMAFAVSPFAGIKLNAKDVIRVEIGTDDEEDYNPKGDKVSYLLQTNKELRRRIHRLEQAMRQMQDQIYRLEDASARPILAVNTPPMQNHTCYIKTTFKGTQIGKGTSEMEARANAMKACDDAGGGFSCDDENVKCGN